MSKRIEEMYLDNRVVTKYISRGILEEKEYKDFINSLPDETKNSEPLKVYTEDNTLTFSSVESLKK